MAGLSIVVRLREGRYDAGGLDPTRAEWPPHPARLFCALVASMRDDADRQALGWLEMAGPPEVWASGEAAIARASGFVVTNKLDKTSPSHVWPGRTNGLRRRAAALPRDDTYAVVWRRAEPDDVTLARLVRLAGRVPYLGRSTSPADVTVVADVIHRRPTWVTYKPVPIGTSGSLALRVAAPGYVDSLVTAYNDEAEIRAWQVPARTLAYAVAPSDPTGAPEPAVLDGPYTDLLVWGITRPAVAVDGDDVLTVTDALRRTVLSRVPNPLPAQVSGHGADGRPHVAYLGLLDVGHAYADGHLLGLGIAVPRDMPVNDRKALLRALLSRPDSHSGAYQQSTEDNNTLADVPATVDGRGLDRLRAGRGRVLELRYGSDTRWGLRPQRWCPTAGSRSWLTATPLMLDRYPKNPRRSADVAESVAAAVVTAGYPQPQDVQPLPTPAVQGGVWRMRPGTIQGRPHRPLLHCRLTFAQPLRGPLLVGALRYLGGGLFAPEEHDADS